MFRTRPFSEISVTVMLVAVMLFNAFAPAPVLARSKEDAGATEQSIQEDVSTTESQPPQNTPLIAEASTDTEPLPQEPTPTPITITLEATPITLPVDGKVSIAWVINEMPADSLKGLSLLLTLPDGFEPVGEEAGKFDPLNNTLSIQILDLKGSVQTATSVSSTEDVFFKATLFNENQQMLSFADLIVPYQKQFELGSQGGVILAESGECKRFDPDMVVDLR